MRIWVAVKRVPDTATRIRPGAAGKTIDTADVKFILNPYDEYAVEEALRLRDKTGAGEVAVISVGNQEAAAPLRQALAMGADRAVLLEAPAATGLELDNYQVAGALAGYLREHPFDMILMGRLAVDLQSSAIGSLLARLLGIPRVSEVTSLEWTGGRFRAHHLVKGQVEVVEAGTPLLLTAQKGLNEPRFPALKGILAAKKKPIETVPAALPEAVLELLRVEPPPPRRPGRIIGQGVEAVPELVRLLRTEAKVLG